MRTINKWDQHFAFADSLIAFVSDLPASNEVVFTSGVRFGIVSQTHSVVTGGGASGFFLSRLVEMSAIDTSLHLTDRNLGELNFRCRVVSFAELKNVKSLVGYGLARFERRSRGSSLAFLQRFGREIGVDLERGEG